MTLTYVYAVSPASQDVLGASGKTYTPTPAGVVTGVVANDALLVTGVGATVRLLLATGATADRPSPSPSPAIAGGQNNTNPEPGLGLPFYDTTLSKTVFFVGTIRSSTGWVDQTGVPA